MNGYEKPPWFEAKDLKPGDQVWFDNPCYRDPIEGKMYDKEQTEAKACSGEEGSNVFYIGKGRVVSIYDGHKVYTINDYQKHMIADWATPKVRRREHPGEPFPEGDFVIKRVRRPLAPRDFLNALLARLLPVFGAYVA